jgi:hypothetical protein
MFLGPPLQEVLEISLLLYCTIASVLVTIACTLAKLPHTTYQTEFIFILDGSQLSREILVFLWQSTLLVRIKSSTIPWKDLKIQYVRVGGEGDGVVPDAIRLIH